MQTDQFHRFMRKWKANWFVRPEVESELRDICKTFHEDTAEDAMRKILKERRESGKTGQYDGPTPNEFYAVMIKLLPDRKRSRSPECCDECARSGWRVVIFCGPNFGAHPATLLRLDDVNRKDYAYARWYWVHRIPCQCLGGEYRRVSYTQFTEAQAKRLYAASFSWAQGAWFCEDIQMYSDHIHNGAPLREKRQPDPQIALIVEKAVASLKSGSTGKSEEVRPDTTDPVVESWDKAEESWI